MVKKTQTPQAEAKATTPPGVSRSELIRGFLATNPGASANEVVDGLAASGTTVSAGLVYQVIRNAAKPKRGGRRANKASLRKPNSAVGTRTIRRSVEVADSQDLCQKMLDYVEAAGGLQKASKLLDMLKQ